MKTTVLIELGVEQWLALGGSDGIQKAIDLYLTPVQQPTVTTDTTTPTV